MKLGTKNKQVHKKFALKIRANLLVYFASVGRNKEA